jgi:hypothetical protein
VLAGERVRRRCVELAPLVEGLVDEPGAALQVLIRSRGDDATARAGDAW